MITTRAQGLSPSRLSATGLSVMATFLALTGPAWSRPIEGVQVQEILRSATTTSGAPITLPEGPVETVVARYSIAPHAALPAHKHPNIRLGYVLSGSLSVTNLQTHSSRVFVAGQAIVEDIDQWHAARNLQARPVELLVIDLVPPGAANTLPRK